MHAEHRGYGRRDRIATALMATAGVSALIAGIVAIFSSSETPGNGQLAEMWWAYGLLVFSGLFFILAWRPRASPGVWELTFAHKVAVAITALTMRSPAIDRAVEIAVVDGLLALVILAGYLLSRGYLGWQRT